jgi:O-glycosyl hydrolase
MMQTSEDLPDNFETIGILFKENFSCCNSCGHADIRDLKADNYFGYVFFHVQDVERAAQTGVLNLSYGSFQNEENYEKDIANGLEIAEKV